MQEHYWCRTAHIASTATPFPEKYLVAGAGQNEGIDRKLLFARGMIAVDPVGLGSRTRFADRVAEINLGLDADVLAVQEITDLNELEDLLVVVKRTEHHEA